jgi:hypothetical protein
MARHTNLQHGRELRRDQCLACGGGIGVGVQRTWARPWQIWPLTLDDHETAAATPDINISTEAEQPQPTGVIPLRTPSRRAAKRS